MTTSFLLPQHPYPHESCTNHAVEGLSPLCSAGSSAPPHGHKCPKHGAPGQLCREGSPALRCRGTQSISSAGRGEKEDTCSSSHAPLVQKSFCHNVPVCLLFLFLFFFLFFFSQETMDKAFKHRTLWKGKEVQSLDTAKPFGSVSTGDCSAKSQSGGQATALGRRSGRSTGKYAFPGGQGSPDGMPCHQVLQAW